MAKKRNIDTQSTQCSDTKQTHTHTHSLFLSCVCHINMNKHFAGCIKIVEVLALLHTQYAQHKKWVVEGQSNGTTDGHKFTSAQHTVTTLSKVVAVSPSATVINVTGIVESRRGYF